MEEAFDAVADGTKSISSAFKDMTQSILKDIAKIIAKEITLGIIKALFGGFSGSAQGNIFEGGRTRNVRAFAKGGIIDSPTLFSTGSGDLGIAGEGGRLEGAIAPLARDRQGNLGVKIIDDERMGGEDVTVNIQIVANDAQGFDTLLNRSEKTIREMIAKAIAQRADFRAAIRGAS